ncbi:hypothetical protein BBF96_08905 [Anoxybacter fermentans]|uniref:Uncharacterized protein n=1 Tax=Anoxybacter fermentans TaxID=1323375 RepID=A0A3Q9HQS6_9FIRM|nr:hypothetical protein [Anoxybacter fermentans]AZR73492.1 hypothetical protein BBF96_08905 [Anoxybacter fermentans]
MKKVYQFALALKLGGIFVAFVSWYVVYEYLIEGKFVTVFFGTIPSLIVTLVVINSFYQKLILDQRGIEMKTIGYVWRKYLRWDELKMITYTGYYGFPFFILIPREGRAMYLSGFKNIDQLLLDIYNFAPHVILHPNVKKRIEKAKRKEQNS